MMSRWLHQLSAIWFCNFVLYHSSSIFIVSLSSFSLPVSRNQPRFQPDFSRYTPCFQKHWPVLETAVFHCPFPEASIVSSPPFPDTPAISRN